MEMKRINSGKLRAIGYDARERLLQVQLDNSDTLQYSGMKTESRSIPRFVSIQSFN